MFSVGHRRHLPSLEPEHRADRWKEDAQIGHKELQASRKGSRKTTPSISRPCAEDEFPTSAEPIDEFDGARTLDRFVPVLSVDQDVGIDQRPRHV